MNTGLENNRTTYRYSQPCNLWCFYSHDVAFSCLPQLHSFWGFWIHSINFLPRIWFINFLSLNFWYHLHTAFCQVSTITSFCQVSFLTSVFLTRICWLVHGQLMQYLTWCMNALTPINTGWASFFHPLIQIVHEDLWIKVVGDIEVLAYAFNERATVITHCDIPLCSQTYQKWSMTPILWPLE